MEASRCCVHDFPAEGVCTRCAKPVCSQCTPDVAFLSRPLCSECAKPEHVGLPIDGWLILPMLIVLLAALFSTIGVIAGVVSCCDEIARDEGALRVIERHALPFAVFLAMAGFSIFTAISFSEHRQRARPLMIAFYVALVGAELLLNVARGVPLFLPLTAVLALIWIPYFLFSKRVRETFVVP